MRPTTGQLGGFGITVLGGVPEPGDLSQALAGLWRHYQFDQSGGSSVVDRAGRSDIPIRKLSDGTSTSLTFGADGVQANAASFTNTNPSSYLALQYVVADADDSHTSLNAQGALAFSFSPGKLLSDYSGGAFPVQQVCGFEGTTTESVTRGGVPYDEKPNCLLFAILGVDLICVTGTGATSTVKSGLTVGQWYSVRASWRKSPTPYLKVWVDGTLVLDSGVYPAILDDSTCKFYVGATSTTATNNYINGADQTDNPWTYGPFIGSIDDAALYTSAHEGSGYDPSKIKYVAATSSISVHPAAIVTKPIRVTDVIAMALRDGGAKARVSQNFAEVVRSAASKTRVTQVFAEILVDNPSPGYAVSATTSLTLTPTARIAAFGHSITVAASSSVALTPSASGIVPADRPVSARTDLTLTGGSAAFVHHPTQYTASASTGLTVSSASSQRIARAVAISASTRIAVSSSCYSPSTKVVSASTSLTIYGVGKCRNSSIYVDAATSLTLKGTAGKPYVFGSKFVSASTAFRVATTPAGLAVGPRYASASTGIGLSTAAKLGRLAILNVSAATRFAVKATATERAEFARSASSSILASASAGQNRDIRAAAETSMALGNQPRTGNLKPVAALGTFTIVASAGVSVTGTLAENRIVFADLAQAVVWIPWRRTSLTLPPGGNLPHS